MRLWSLHPKYLDRRGLLACWREALLAQKVLQGATKGYRNHPQLVRFCGSTDPRAAIAAYLAAIADEAEERGYRFDRAKIPPAPLAERIPVTRGQVLYEWERLKAKLRLRDRRWLLKISGQEVPEVHPLFQMTEGEVELWEKLV